LIKQSPGTLVEKQTHQQAHPVQQTYCEELASETIIARQRLSTGQDVSVDISQRFAWFSLPEKRHRRYLYQQQNGKGYALSISLFLGATPFFSSLPPRWFASHPSLLTGAMRAS